MNILTHCVRASEDTFYDLTVVHFLIGCKSTVGRSGFPIHEFPKLARNMFTSPEDCFDSNALSYIQNGGKFKIRQILYLIDPAYKTTRPEITDAAIKELSKSGDVVSKNIISSIYIFMHPMETAEEEMSILVNIFKNNPKYLINIQDTTGIDMCRKYDSNYKIHRLHADCFLDTSDTYACPPISHMGQFRWINLFQDCYRRNDSFETDYVVNYITATARHVFCKYEFVALVRLWNLNDMNEDIFTVTGEKIKLAHITDKTYNKYYKIAILPYISYRVGGNEVEYYILKFIESWYLSYIYVIEKETKTFRDMIISECKLRADILNETFLTAKDIANICSKRTQSSV